MIWRFATPRSAGRKGARGTVPGRRAWRADGLVLGVAAPLHGVGRDPAARCAQLPDVPGRQRVEHQHLASCRSIPTAPSGWPAWTARTTNLHPDFGPSGDPSTPYGIPYTVVSPSQPLVNVSFQYAAESDPGPYPFGADTPIEGGSQSTGDRHAIMVNPSTCTLYELYDATYSPSGSTAGSGAIWNLNSNALRPSGWTSADAAGLPILPGLVRYDEVQSGAITHAIRMTAESTDTSFIWPARHEAGTVEQPGPPAHGGPLPAEGQLTTSPATRRRRRSSSGPCSSTA